MTASGHIPHCLVADRDSQPGGRLVSGASHELFVGEIVATWTEQRFLDEAGRPDITKMRPFTLTMPDNRYWAVGEQIGRAWSDGRGFVVPGSK
jgi:flavin reductase (DIM6/NTAB) family NADH-FMN oxidoreductase RutF